MKHRSSYFILIEVISFVFLFTFFGIFSGGAQAECPGPSFPAEQEEIMQFKAGGHVLGFGSDKVYMAGLGYALIEEFVGASRVKPVAGSSHESDPSRDSGTKGMGSSNFHGVMYPELWKGISVRYESTAGGLAESIYVLQPGAKVQDIRIRYNADFSIENDGSLRFSHSTGKGYFSLSSPVAWQEISGRKIPVEVSFKDRGDRTLGFSVDALNPHYALIIDPTYEWHTFYGSSTYDDG